MTSPARLTALCRALEYVAANEIAGSIVECGVWRGGSMMAVADTLRRLRSHDRDLYLFDTFSGMPPPQECDRRYDGVPAAALLQETDRNTDDVWALCHLEKVRSAMQRIAYDPGRIHFVKGMIEDTVPRQAPDTIALLRLDTDWYESTRHELVHLFPRLAVGGVLIIDDYGFWQGSRRAVDEYLAENRIPLLLCPIDETGRICVKQRM